MQAIGCNFCTHKYKTQPKSYPSTMKIEEAIIYAIALHNGGMTTDQIAEAINRHRLHIRKDGQPVSSSQVYAVVCRYPSLFVKECGKIMLMM